MDSITLTAAASRDTGKKATKATRNEGRVPCVLYGPSTEPVHFSVPALDLRPLIHTTETYRVLVTVDGEEHEAILKDVDFHPITDAPIHADFLALTKGQKLTLTIPIHLEGAAPGVKAGGKLAQPLHELEIASLPKDIPGHVSIDISTMQVGDSLHVGDLSLGDTIEVLTDPVRTIVTVMAPRVEATEEEDEGITGLDAVAPEGDAAEASAEA
ncbi:MAG TPA: 50S ribosomal protein L25 [Bacteroidetes bacterium]|nr:50S ribosomal protein L25 [Bacteroidota bacterium]HIL58914.1 50S ribosomal protein L25 [Rhodothermales bacterium]